MNPLIVIAAIGGGLLFISLLLRINAIFLFVAVATGDLLSRYIGDSAGLAISGFIHGAQADNIGHLFLLWVPVLLAILFLRKTLPTSTLFLQTIPLIATSATAALLTLGLLSLSFQHSVYGTPIGKQIDSFRDIILASSGATTLLVILIIGRARHEEGGKRSKRH